MTPLASTRTRAVVVDDSSFMRLLITDILEEGGISVVAQAADGVEAVAAVAEHRPDVVTMDIHMPRMDGIEAVEAIMGETPTPILVLSAYADGAADVTFEALSKGAVDFFTKPGGPVSPSIPRIKDELVEKVLGVSETDLNAYLHVKPSSRVPGASVNGESFLQNATLVVGASTGGPTVVERLLADLPAAANLRILVVQHMPAGFTARFADRLDAVSAYRVREASDGDWVAPGEALVAPGGYHMEVVDSRDDRIQVRLTTTPPLHGVRPAVDVTMTTAAQHVTDPLVGVVLTGMGADGAAGIQYLKSVGATTFAQDERTAAIFGMPKRAIETGCIDEVLPAERIVDGIVRSVAVN